MKEEKVNPVYKTLFIWSVLISIIIIFCMIVTLRGASSSINNYEENYERSCDNGEHKVCVPEDSSLWHICDERYEAKCIEEDKAGIISSRGSISYCESDETPRCVDD